MPNRCSSIVSQISTLAPSNGDRVSNGEQVIDRSSEGGHRERAPSGDAMREHEGRARALTGRRRVLVQASIFIGLAALAPASAALPPGPSNLGLYWASLAVLVVCASAVFLPWRRLPRWAVLVPAVGYLVSVTLLLISGGTDPSVQSTAG